jgi:hypothetical protein
MDKKRIKIKYDMFDNKNPNGIDLVAKDALLNLNVHSPKWDTIIKNITNKNGQHLLYSDAVKGGIDLFGKALEMRSWVDYTEIIIKEYNAINKDKSSQNLSSENIKENIDDIDENIEHILPLKIKKNKTDENKTNKIKTKDIKNKQVNAFIKITGDIDPIIRSYILNIMNNVENALGHKIKLIMISDAGTQGLDFKYLQHIHIMSSYWNWMVIEQVIGRGIRLYALDNLPVETRKVYSYLYLSDYPENMPKSSLPKSLIDEETTDITLYLKSSSMYKVIIDFYVAIAEASIDCKFHNKNVKLHCRACAPTNEPLYLESWVDDLKTKSNCRPISETNEDALEIIYNDNKYAYTLKKLQGSDKTKKTSNIEIYKYNPVLDGYTILEYNDPAYSELYKIITK